MSGYILSYKTILQSILNKTPNITSLVVILPVTVHGVWKHWMFIFRDRYITSLYRKMYTLMIEQGRFLPENHQDDHWFEFLFPHWSVYERKQRRKDSLGTSHSPKRAQCQSVQSGTWVSSCIHLLSSCQASSENLWGLFGFWNDPGGFVSGCQCGVT